MVISIQWKRLGSNRMSRFQRLALLAYFGSPRVHVEGYSNVWSHSYGLGQAHAWPVIPEECRVAATIASNSINVSDRCSYFRHPSVFVGIH